MKRAPSAVLLAVASVALAGSAAATAQGLRESRLFGGEVQVVAYADGDVRICPPYGDTLVYGPPHVPSCATGLRATGVDVTALKTQETGRPERWGYLYLIGRYTQGTF